MRRDAATLNWQYKNQPGKKFDIIGFYENEKLLGYTVLYFRKKDKNAALQKAAITDLFYDSTKPSEIIDKLIQAALQLTLERRAGALVTDVSDSLVKKRLKAANFSQIKNPLQLLVKTEARRDILENINEWFVTRGDSDASVFEQPNLD